MKSTLFAAITAFGLVMATPVFAMTTDQVPQTATGGFWNIYQNAAHPAYGHGHMKTADAEMNVDNQQKLADAEMNVDNQQKLADAEMNVDNQQKTA